MIDRSALTGPLGLSLLAIVMTLIIVAVQLPTFVDAALQPGAVEDEATAMLDEFCSAHTEQTEANLSRINGRSMFEKPKDPRPPRRAPIAAPQPVAEPVETAPPVREVRYMGPTVAWIGGGKVYFKDQDFGLAVGEEYDDVKVISIDRAQTCTLEYRGKQFEFDAMDARSDGQYSFVRDSPPGGRPSDFGSEDRDRPVRVENENEADDEDTASENDAENTDDEDATAATGAVTGTATGASDTATDATDAETTDDDAANDAGLESDENDEDETDPDGSPESDDKSDDEPPADPGDNNGSPATGTPPATGGPGAPSP